MYGKSFLYLLIMFKILSLIASISNCMSSTSRPNYLLMLKIQNKHIYLRKH